MSSVDDDAIGRLRAFLAVFELGTFTEAASALGISQPALSRRVRRLEDIVGAPLLVRGTSRVRLTPTGRGMLEPTRAAVDSYHRALRSGRLHARGEGRLLVLGCQSGLDEPLLSNAVRDSNIATDDRVLVLERFEATRLLGALLDGRVDVAIGDEHVLASADVAVRVVAERAWKVAVAPGHRLAGQDSVRSSDIGDPRVVIADARRVIPSAWRHAPRADGHWNRDLRAVVVDDEIAAVCSDMAARVEAQGLETVRVADAPSERLVQARLLAEAERFDSGADPLYASRA